MDLSIQTNPGAPTRDYGWLAGDGGAFETAQSCTLDVSEFTSGTHYPADTKVLPSGVALAKIGDVFVPWSGANEVQTVTITGIPTGGTFTLTFQGETTAAIAFNANAAAVQAALEALSNIEVGDVVVTGTNPAFTVTFGGELGGENVSQLTSTGSLTGGTAPAVAHATTTAGGSSVAGQEILAGFLAHPIELLRDNGTTSDTVLAAYIVDATIHPDRLPVAAQRTINRNTPTTGKFGFVS